MSTENQEDIYKILMNNGYCACVAVENKGIYDREENKVKNIDFDTSEYMPYELLPVDKNLFEAFLNIE